MPSPNLIKPHNPIFREFGVFHCYQRFYRAFSGIRVFASFLGIQFFGYLLPLSGIRLWF